MLSTPVGSDAPRRRGPHLQRAPTVETVADRFSIGVSSEQVSGAVGRLFDYVKSKPHFQPAGLENVFDKVVAGGLTRLGYPSAPTHPPGRARRKYAFQRIDGGFRLTLSGPGVGRQTLLLNPDLGAYDPAGVSQLPQGQCDAQPTSSAPPTAFLLPR